MRLVTRLRRHVGALAAASVVALGGTATLVVVSAAPASATTVTTESEFRDAWNTDSAITLGADITLTCDGGRAERTGDDNFVLDGQGHTITQTCPGNGVLKVDSESGANGIVRNVTITGGTESEPGEHGGGLYFDGQGTLDIDHVAFLDNTTCADGGGLDYEGDELTITHSTLAGNHAHGYGGALWAGGVTGVVTDSTVSGNEAGVNAGAFETGGADLTLAYVTMVQNGIAPLSGCEAPTATVGHGPTSSAATFEQIDNGEEGTLTSFGSVIALPPSAGEFNCFLSTSPSASQGYNFSDDHSCGFTDATDRQDAGDPGLGALGANGGLAPTQVPQAGSPLLDAIPVAACQTGAAAGITDDERDITRPQGTGCDIGAVEVVVETPTPLPLVVTPHFTG